MIYKCYFDGACDVNPGGNMGIGVYITSNDSTFKSVTYFDGFKKNEINSNNVSEYLAFQKTIELISDLVDKNDSVFIHGDSKMVIYQMAMKWKIKNGNYKEYARSALEQIKQLKSICDNISIGWIPREKNEIADELSKMGIEKLGISNDNFFKL